jgi:hypothetical protein
VRQDSIIYHKEMFAVCVAIYMSPSNISLRIFTDNSNVVHAVQSGGSDEIPINMVRWMKRQAVVK